MPKIISRRVWFDWVAHHQSEQDPQHIGWGRTKQEALTNLLRLDVERQERDSQTLQ